MRLIRRKQPVATPTDTSGEQEGAARGPKLRLGPDGGLEIDLRGPEPDAVACVNCGAVVRIDHHDDVSGFMVLACPTCGFTTSKKVPRTS